MQPSNDEALRYTRPNIERSEALYGYGFQSPGGQDTVREFAEALGITSASAIVDLGSGVGGAVFYLAERFGATAVGVDASPDMIAIATERLAARPLPRVSFVQGYLEDAKLDVGSFDLAWTRDTIVCIADKAAVWSNVHRCLKPGGRVFSTDFCRTRRPLSSEFAEYASRCAYFLQDLDDYARALTAAGFRDVTAEDITSRLHTIMRDELARLEAQEAEFTRRFSADDFRYMRDRWQKKVDFIAGGDLVWGKFAATK